MGDSSLICTVKLPVEKWWGQHPDDHDEKSVSIDGMISGLGLSTFAAGLAVYLGAGSGEYGQGTVIRGAA